VEVLRGHVGRDGEVHGRLGVKGHRPEHVRVCVPACLCRGRVAGCVEVCCGTREDATQGACSRCRHGVLVLTLMCGEGPFPGREGGTRHHESKTPCTRKPPCHARHPHTSTHLHATR
jgi:hypothetical protein